MSRSCPSNDIVALQTARDGWKWRSFTIGPIKKVSSRSSGRTITRYFPVSRYNVVALSVVDGRLRRRQVVHDERCRASLRSPISPLRVCCSKCRRRETEDEKRPGALRQRQRAQDETCRMSAAELSVIPLRGCCSKRRRWEAQDEKCRGTPC